MEKRDENRDPITGEPGSHPVGTGVGSAGGAMAGAAIGAIGGPIGMLIGGAIGAVAGGAVGHGVGERIDPTGEESYWKSQHNDKEWNDVGPAYRYGWESRMKHADRRWDNQLENDLSTDWNKARGTSSLEWDKARQATRRAWERADHTFNTYRKTDSTWRDRYRTADYYDSQFDYERDYRPAYNYGTYLRHSAANGAWDDNAAERGWDRVKGDSRLTWDKAKRAARDAWDSVERAMPGDADHDGR